MTDIFKTWFAVSKFLPFTLFFLVILLIIKYYYSKRRFFQLGSKLPGHKPLPIIGGALELLNIGPLDLLPKLRKLQAEHGNHEICSLWLGHHLMVLIYSPELAKEFCHSPKLIDRGKSVRVILPLAPKGVLFSSGHDWKKARKVTEGALPYWMLKKSIPLIQREGNILVERLQCQVGKPNFPIHDYLMEWAYDVISVLSVEQEKKAQRGEIKNLQYAEAINRLTFKRLFNPFQQWDFMYNLSSDGKEFKSVVNVLRDEVDDEVRSRRKEIAVEKERAENGEISKPKRKIFWQDLLEDESLTDDERRDHLITVVMSGTETTSNTIGFALSMLSLYPEVQEKVYQEIISITDGHLDEEKLNQLKYLKMVIKETMRLFPAVTLNVRHAAEDVQLGKYLIPKGTEVSLNIFELQRSPEVYENPDEFNPDNFLPENVAKRHSYAYMPFSTGFRKCIGFRLAMLSMKILLSQLLLNFKIESDYKSVNDVTSQILSYTSMNANDGFKIRLLKR